MRSFVESLGESFRRAGWVEFVSAILSILALLKAYNLWGIDIDGWKDFFLWIVVIIGISLILVIVSHAIGTGLTILSENIPAAVIAKPNLSPETRRVFINNVNTIVQDYFWQLGVTNNENSELTNCYAVVRTAKISSSKADTNEFIGVSGKRLKWDNGQNMNNCEISIPLRGGKAKLNVYHLIIESNGGNNNIKQSDFSVCNNDTKRLLPVGLYDLEIDFYGRIKGKDVKINPFIGNIKIEVSQEGDSIKFPINIVERKSVR